MTGHKRKYHIKIPHEDDRIDVTLGASSAKGIKCGACGAAWNRHKAFVSADERDKWTYATSNKNPKIHILSIQ